MSLLFGGLAALGWGVADYLASIASREGGTLRANIIAQVSGLAVLTLVVVASGDLAAALSKGTAVVWALGLLGAGLVTFATQAFYTALQLGKTAIVSPISSSYGAVTTLLCWLGGAAIGGRALLGLLLAVVGVAAIAARGGPDTPHRAAPRARLPPGVSWALMSAVAYGLTFHVFGTLVAPVLGPMVPIWLARLVAPIVLVAAGRLRPAPAPGPWRWWIASITGVLATAAGVACGFGLVYGDIAVVTVLGSLSTAVTVVLALILRGERFSRGQAVGVALTLLGIVLLNL